MSRRWEQTSLIGELQDFEHFFPNKEVSDKGYKAESVAKWPWDSTTAYYSEYSDVLGRNIRFLEPDFVSWYKDLSESDRISWVKDMTSFDLHKEADDVYDEYSNSEVAERFFVNYGGREHFLEKNPNFSTPAEFMRSGCFYVEAFVYWCNYAYLIEEVNKAISKGHDHDRYVSEKIDEEVFDLIEHMRGKYGFMLSEDELPNENILALTRLYRFFSLQKDYSIYAKCIVPPGLQYRVQEKAEELRGAYENIRKTCSEAELKAISIAYDAYLEKQKSKKQLSKQEQEIFPIIKEAYEVWNSADNKKNEIYKKATRMAGHAFSKR
tara:strand:+ start:395 stop:1363 length:969 start_codon:yes stop_codon:yes gene_type:complete